MSDSACATVASAASRSASAVATRDAAWSACALACSTAAVRLVDVPLQFRGVDLGQDLPPLDRRPDVHASAILRNPDALA